MRTMFARAVLGVAMVVTIAGCGQTLTIGSSASGAPSPNSGIQLIPGARDPGAAPGTPAAPIPLGSLSVPLSVQFSAKQTKLGQVVTDTEGRTLYRFDQDSPKPPKTTCTGGCQTTWPPVLVQPQGKVYADGVNISAVGTVTRADGGLQLTIGGWPVYRFSGDHAAGDTAGQGVNGTWFAIAPDGKKSSTAGADTAGSAGGPKVILTTRQSAQGLVVADGDGRTVYVNSTDQSAPATVKCTGGCDDGFTPVPAATGVVTIKGVSSSDVGSVKRPDGSTEMTLLGFPLYTSTKDVNPGDTAGSGVRGWFAISLTGGQ